MKKTLKLVKFPLFIITLIVQKINRKGVNFLKAWTIPGAFLACFSYGFIKIIDYGFLFWLPEYFNDVLNLKGT